MSVPRPIYALTFCLIAGLLAAASPARAEPAQNFNDAQLKLLFSGARVVATGDATCQNWSAAGDLTLKFDFNADGTFTVVYNCTDHYVAEDDGTDTGKWRAEDGKLCVDFRTSVMSLYLPTDQNCWEVRHSPIGMAFYVADTPFWQFSVSHPQFPTKEKLLAALEEMSGPAALVAGLATLPPAPYKPLPVGTRVNYDQWSYIVTRSEGLEVAKKTNTGNWVTNYAVFGKQGDNVYTPYGGREADWVTKLGEENRSALAGLWPLEVGKKAVLNFEEFKPVPTAPAVRIWDITIEVVRTEFVELNGLRYPTYVVREHAVSEEATDQKGTTNNVSSQATEYWETRWFNPDSGLILKFDKEFVRGHDKGAFKGYSLTTATFPEGTTTHALKGTPISGKVQTAKATTLPPAPYKAPTVGTKIKYDDRIYRVTRTDGFLTVYRSITGNKLSYLNAYALFGEFADDLHVSTVRGVIPFDIDADNRKKLEAFWPLERGKKITYTLVEEATGVSSPEEWNITLEVTGAEVLNLQGTDYAAYVIGEKGRSESGKIYVGRKWYHPGTGLIVKAERTWEKSFEVKMIEWYKNPHFAEGDEDNYTLVRVRFPEDAVAVAAKPEPKAPPAVAAAEVQRLKQAAEKARAEVAQKARAQKIARLERKAEEKRQADEKARKARAIEIARLKREAEAASRARKAEVSKATATEMARLKQEAEAVRRVHEAEIANLKHEAEAIRKAREARETEIARLKREAEEFHKALAERDALEAREEKARKAEIASLRKQLDEFLKASKTAQAPKESKADGLAGIEFGNYHALVIGIDNYKNLPKLTTAIKDARGVAKILKEEYGFKVSLLIDPDRLDIIDAFDELQDNLTEKDNLLIYYAGHGWLNQDVDRGYWMPVDAKPGRRGRWISNATITDTLKGLSAKHVMVVADSCYSGTLVRAADVGTRKRGGDYWKEMADKWARVAITSGGLEPVADKGGSGHSPFAKAFIDALSSNDSIIDGLQLFGKIRRPVMVAAQQTPQYADVRQAGHDGGDFLFVRRK